MPRRDTNQQTAKRARAAEWGKDRDSWAHLNNVEATLFVGDGTDDDEYAEADGIPSVRLGIRNKGKFAFITLSSFTVDELDVLREMFDRACDTARPSCEKLDALANQPDIEEISDATLMRLYRPVPGLLVSPRSKRRDNPRVPIGPERVPELDEPSRPDDGPEVPAAPRDARGAVPHGRAQDVGGENDAAEADDDSVMGAP